MYNICIYVCHYFKHYTNKHWPFPLVSITCHKFSNARNKLHLLEFLKWPLHSFHLSNSALFLLRNLSRRHSFRQKNRLRVTSSLSLPGSCLTLGSKRSVIQEPGALLLFLLSALIDCNLITEDLKSYTQLCSSGGVENSETWSRPGLFSFLFVSHRALGLNL